MALLFIDGFGGGDSATGKWSAGSDSYTVSNASPRIAGCYYALTGVTVASFYKSFTASARIHVGCGVRMAASNYISFLGDSAATTHITVIRNASGYVEIRRGTASGTLLATGTTVLPSNQWHYIEVSVTISDTVGEVHVRLNGQSTDEVSFTGDTKNAGTNTTVDAIRIVVPSGSGGSLSDVYILNSTGSVNNTFLGDVVVRTLSPSGNGTYSQLTGSDGDQIDNYLMVDEHPYSSTDYVGSATVGLHDTYAMSDLPAGVTAVYGVQLTGSMAKSDASAASAKLMLRTNSANYYGATAGLSTSYTTYSSVFETNPATATQWTISEVNGAEAGMEVV